MELHHTPCAALFLEGETQDRHNGRASQRDALLQAVLPRGLKLTTELLHMVLTPAPGWRCLINESGTVTLHWPPHHRPLLDDVPLDLPDGWIHTAAEHESIVVFGGYSLGLHEHARNGPAHPVRRLTRVAKDAALAVGTVPRIVRAPAVADAP